MYIREKIIDRSTFWKCLEDSYQNAKIPTIHDRGSCNPLDGKFWFQDTKVIDLKIFFSFSQIQYDFKNIYHFPREKSKHFSM